MGTVADKKRTRRVIVWACLVAGLFAAGLVKLSIDDHVQREKLCAYVKSRPDLNGALQAGQSSTRLIERLKGGGYSFAVFDNDGATVFDRHRLLSEWKGYPGKSFTIVIYHQVRGPWLTRLTGFGKETDHLSVHVDNEGRVFGSGCQRYMLAL